jgi:CHASE3 domain sensor protein
MLEQVESTIIAFLLGSVLTYFATRWSKILKKIDKLEFGVQALLRDRMLQMYSYYKEKGKPVPLREVESFEAMYSAYRENEGNSFMPDVRKEFMELEHETH